MANSYLTDKDSTIWRYIYIACYKKKEKVEYLRNEVNVLEMKKWESTNQILKLNRMIDEFEGSLAKKRGEMTNMIQET